METLRRLENIRLNWTKVGLKVDYVSYPMSPNGYV